RRRSTRAEWPARGSASGSEGRGLATRARLGTRSPGRCEAVGSPAWRRRRSGAGPPQRPRRDPSPAPRARGTIGPEHSHRTGAAIRMPDRTEQESGPRGDRLAIARALREMAALLGAAGGEGFRARAYVRGARALEHLAEGDLGALVEQRRLTELPSI